MDESLDFASDPTCYACNVKFDFVTPRIHAPQQDRDYHEDCFNKEHTFFQVYGDGVPGPLNFDLEEAEEQIRSEKEVEWEHKDVLDEMEYEIKKRVMTYREFESLREWDGW